MLNLLLFLLFTLFLINYLFNVAQTSLYLSNELFEFWEKILTLATLIAMLVKTRF